MVRRVAVLLAVLLEVLLLFSATAACSKSNADNKQKSNPSKSVSGKSALSADKTAVRSNNQPKHSSEKVISESDRKGLSDGKLETGDVDVENTMHPGTNIPDSGDPNPNDPTPGDLNPGDSTSGSPGANESGSDDSWSEGNSSNVPGNSDSGTNTGDKESGQIGENGENQKISNPEPYIFPDYARLPAELTGNDRVTLDIGNTSNGLLKVKHNHYLDIKVKLLIDKDGTRYTYDLPADGQYHWYPLQMGSGQYTVTIAENVQGTSYMPVYNGIVHAQIADNKTVFLIPNMIVWYNSDSTAVKLAWDLVTGIEEDIVRAEAIHKYIIDNIKYDYDRLSNVAPGYVPDIEQVLLSGKGICFDYAALFASMMRSLNIPAKLVMGYVSPQNVYHAWNEIYIEGKGWIKVIHARLFDSGWALVDATFDAAGASEVTGNGENYLKKYEY